MRRWTLNLIGLALLAIPVLLSWLGVLQLPGTTGRPDSTEGIPAWLSLSISAGAYFIDWSPVMVGVLVLYYANRHRG